MTSNLLNFVSATFPGYRAGWFHRRVAELLELFLAGVVAGTRPRLILTAPPQHGKTQIASCHFPAFAFGKAPDLAVIATAYNSERANQVSAMVQRIMESGRYRLLFPNAAITERGHIGSQATRRIDRFEIIGHRGFYRAAGVGSGITGTRADLLIADDLIKSEAEAQSPKLREKTWDWFTSAAITRLSNGGGAMIVTTRWHQDDLVGRLENLAKVEGTDSWPIFNFPAIAEEVDAFRQIGEPLSVERYTLESLQKTKRMIGSYKFAALYQQHPTPPEGGIIQRCWIKCYLAMPDCLDEIVQSWDCSFKSHASSDFVAGQVWGRSGADFYLLDRVHGRMDCPSTMAAIRQLAAKWPQATRILIEAAANGVAVVDMLRNELAGIIPVPPQGTKQARMYAVSALFESGNVYVPAPALAPWVGDVIEEWLGFPYALYDDDCDAMTQALLRLKLHPDYGPTPYLVGFGDDLPNSCYDALGQRKELIADTDLKELYRQLVEDGNGQEGE
jgi:predicted phage terminase large subunit-like protein